MPSVSPVLWRPQASSARRRVWAIQAASARPARRPAMAKAKGTPKEANPASRKGGWISIPPSRRSGLSPVPSAGTKPSSWNGLAAKVRTSRKKLRIAPRKPGAEGGQRPPPVPAREGREDAEGERREQRAGAEVSQEHGCLFRGCGGEARRALRQQGAGMEDAVLLEPALDHHLDAGLEDVGQRPAVVDREGGATLGGGEAHLQAAVEPLHVVLDRSQHPRLTGPRVLAQLGDRPVVLGVAGRRREHQVADAGGQHGGQRAPAEDHRGASAWSAERVSSGSLPGTLRAIETSFTPTLASASRRSRHSSTGPMMAVRSTISSVTSAIASSFFRSR